MAPNNKDKPTLSPPQQNQQKQPQPETLLYFAFGSNLSSTQMRARCPEAAAVGLALLPGYDFIINERGFANVVPAGSSITTTASRSPSRSRSPSSSSGGSTKAAGDGRSSRHGGRVYGVLYRLASAAEKERLDRYEGVPWAYEDLVLGVELLAPGGAGGSGSGSGSGTTPVTETARALVYVDRARVSPAAPRAEYVSRMNAGIREAGAEWGLPPGYVRDVMRRYIPADDDDDDDE